MLWLLITRHYHHASLLKKRYKKLRTKSPTIHKLAELQSLADGSQPILRAEEKQLKDSKTIQQKKKRGKEQKQSKFIKIGI